MPSNERGDARAQQPPNQLAASRSMASRRSRLERAGDVVDQASELKFLVKRPLLLQQPSALKRVGKRADHVARTLVCQRGKQLVRRGKRRHVESLCDLMTGLEPLPFEDW